ncbi:MAG TPA: hypothetical protein DDY78_13120 [Planctomycetales bacterium]|jgi:hypothetical protein|nr:hypothetical protein [Planctomycetales bacterium]
MAKRTQTTHAATGQDGQPQGKNISSYIRRVFGENPKWLETRSNDEVLARWLKDHPGETEVPDRVKKNLSNVKSLLRNKLRKKAGKPKKESQPAGPTAAPRSTVRGLETLEEQLDECLTLAKNLDREGLSSVINLLRRARNEVVWKMGE